MRVSFVGSKQNNLSGSFRSVPGYFEIAVCGKQGQMAKDGMQEELKGAVLFIWQSGQCSLTIDVSGNSSSTPSKVYRRVKSTVLRHPEDAKSAKGKNDAKKAENAQSQKGKNYAK